AGDAGAWTAPRAGGAMAAGPVAVSASWCSGAALTSRRSPTPAAKAALSRMRGAGLSSNPRSPAADTALLPSSFAATRRTHGFSAPSVATRSETARGSVMVPASESLDRKSTRLNSSHVEISYAVFCLKKKKKTNKKYEKTYKNNKTNKRKRKNHIPSKENQV